MERVARVHDVGAAVTYHAREPRFGDTCHDCGAPAVVVLVADFPEHGTGYQDDRAFCARCDPDADEGYPLSLGDA